MKERWVDITWAMGQYQVSDLGNVRSLKRLLQDGRSIKGKMLKCNTSRKGRTVSIRANGVTRTITVSRLVVSMFYPDMNLKRKRILRKGGLYDDSLGNLYWITAEEARKRRAAQKAVAREKKMIGMAATKKFPSEVVCAIKNFLRENGGKLSRNTYRKAWYIDGVVRFEETCNDKLVRFHPVTVSGYTATFRTKNGSVEEKHTVLFDIDSFLMVGYDYDMG